MLWDNAQRAVPTAAQRGVLPATFNDPLRSPYLATFLTPPLAEHTDALGALPGRLSAGMAEELTRLGWGPQLQPGGGTRSWRVRRSPSP